MPEHCHLLITKPDVGDASLVMKVINQRFARRLNRKSQQTSAAQTALWEPTPDSVWQKRFYDFNVWSERKQIEKLRYMHRNPVKRGLVAQAGPVEVEQLSCLRVWRARSGAGEIPGMAAGNQTSSGGEV